VYYVSDKAILDNPDLLLKVYQSLLETCGFTLLTRGDGIYKIAPKVKVGRAASGGNGFEATLRGTIPCTSDPKKGVAFIKSKVGSKELVAFIDEPITYEGKPYDEFAGWKLIEVTKDKAVFSDGNQRQELIVSPQK